MKPIIISGIKPSGILHIGNYLGMLKQSVDLQESGEYSCLYFVADYHSLTTRYKPEEKSAEVMGIITDLLAAGLDPKKSVLFVQSHVLEHTNLAWIFNTLTSMGQLERMVEYKEKVAEGQVPNAGLFDYPVLMAADILLYKAQKVPVGEDQRQHLELARDIARTFNKKFGETFPEPEGVFTKALRVMSLSDPEKKMSKTMPAGCLYLTDSPKKIAEKIGAAVTDSQKEVGYDPKNRPGISNLVNIYAEFNNETPAAVVKRFQGASYKEFKGAVAELVSERLREIQERKAGIEKNKKEVLQIISNGAETVRPIAQKTLAEVKNKIGLI